MMNNRRRFIPFWIPLLFGIMALTNVLTRPSFQLVRAVDAVTLVAAGMCFGAALVAFVQNMRDRRAS
jgi:hypothetical protein